MAAQTAPAIRPLVEIIDGKAFTNSFKIAERFGKNHKDILRAIELLECSSEFRKRNFAPTSAPVPMPRGGYRYIPAYTITRDGFTFLAMGFTGKEAAQWKEAYIEAFNRMEAELRKSAHPVSSTPQPHPMIFGQPGQRYLVAFSEDGQRYSAKPISHECCVMTPWQFLNALGEPNGLLTGVETAALFEVVDRFQRLIRGRCAPVVGQKEPTAR